MNKIASAQTENGRVRDKTEGFHHHNALVNNTVKRMKDKFRRSILRACEANPTFTSDHKSQLARDTNYYY